MFLFGSCITLTSHRKEKAHVAAPIACLLPFDYHVHQNYMDLNDWLIG